mgnify:CR=1 FL=1
MSILTFRSYTGEADLQAMIALTQALRARDRGSIPSPPTCTRNWPMPIRRPAPACGKTSAAIWSGSPTSVRGKTWWTFSTSVHLPLPSKPR